MKAIVIYYSLTGNTKFIAEQIAQKSGAEILALKPEKDFKAGHNLVTILWGGRQSMTKVKPKLLPLTKNPADYDLIFLGTPVWAFTFAPAVRSFLAENKIKDKKIALFLCHGGTPGKAAANLEKELAGNEIIGEILFNEPLKTPEESRRKTGEWLHKIIN
ncbi:MAG: flavodoxin [Patescibacteria group bacterium]|jgi:flavodoxin